MITEKDIREAFDRASRGGKAANTGLDMVREAVLDIVENVPTYQRTADETRLLRYILNTVMDLKQKQND